LRIAISAHPQYQPAHGIRTSPAVIDKVSARLVSVNPLVLLESVQQIVKRLNGNLVATNCLGQGLIDGTARLAGVAGMEALTKAGERLHCLAAVRQFISQIVAGAAEGVDVTEILPQRPGEQERNDGKILVMRMG